MLKKVASRQLPTQACARRRHQVGHGDAANVLLDVFGSVNARSGVPDTRSGCY